MKLAVVILNWNGKKYLEKFLPSVIANTPIYCNIYVADNASTDDSIAFLNTHYPSVKLIQNNKNDGFAKGYNDALKHVKEDYYVLLNSDVEVTPGWIEPVLETLQRNENIAACQPKILGYSDKNKFEYAGAAGGFIDKYGYPFCRGRIFNVFEQDNGQYNDEKEIFWATGACLFISSKAFHLVGGFDEDFFAHMEEIDLCWRLKNLGYKIMYCPTSVVYHVGGGTLSKINPQKTFLNFRNNLVLYFKNHNSKYFWIKIAIRFILDGIAGAQFLFIGKGSHCLAVLKAHISFYSSFKKTLHKRKQLKKQIKNYTTTGIYRKSIVFDFFLLKRTKFSQLSSTNF